MAKKIFKIDASQPEVYASRTWLYFGESFKVAADILHRELLSDKMQSSLLVIPTFYLYRHYIELKLKEIIVEGQSLLGIKNVIPKGGHDLYVLWKDASKTLVDVWLEAYKEPAASIERKIKEINSVDFKSDTFRYPISKKGEQPLKHITEIDFQELEEIKYFLEGVVDGLYHLKDAHSQ